MVRCKRKLDGCANRLAATITKDAGFDVLAATITKDAAGAYGLHLAARGGHLLIAGVDVGSSAERAGLRAGLRVLSLSSPDGAFESRRAEELSHRALVATLLQHGSVTFHCAVATAAELGATASRCSDAEESLIEELRPALSSSELDEVRASALTLRAAAHVYDEGGRHQALFLHAGGHFQREAPALWARLLALMRCRCASPCVVRCIEYHTYREGGALLDAGHRDVGSNLTLSVLLSDTADLCGGRFLTYDEAQRPVAHELGRGDGVLFRSERVHHVEVVTRGVRHALVVELWDAERGVNTVDRHG